MRKLGLIVASVAVVTSGFAVTGCSSSRHCEHDATDATVDDSFCEKGTAGYEWENDSSSKSKKKKRRR
ncbi:hypothetical protein [Nocardioides speluncae]|uniref:hypothetical protein n=1 Tax=Nocardioides speluncae TaxID=2670337 RepID=UPI000D685466|nr:hypothetical protein [Nocardioides speluncae]